MSAAALPDTGRPAHDAPLAQSALHACAVRSLGARTRRIELPGAEAWAICRRFPLLGEVALISRGPAEIGPETARVLPTLTGARHLIVNAEDDRAGAALRAAGFWRIAEGRWIAELPLRASPDAMAAAMSVKWRNRLRHGLAQRLRITRSRFPPDARHWLLLAEARAAHGLGYRPFPPAMIAALAAARAGAGQLFTAEDADGPVAAMLFFRHGARATYQIGWSTETGRAASAGNVLMWRGMLELQAMGVGLIDLGLADPRHAPGLARFKTGAGGRLRQLGGTWLRSAALPARPF